MKKSVVFAVLYVCVAFCLAYASDAIKGPLPDKFPPPEKCAACHDVSHIYKELLQSGHKGLKCLDCHIPGAVQKAKYESKDCSFHRLGYHDKDGKWVEAGGNEPCLRCHAAKGMTNTAEKCWSCHMVQDGMDHLRILKDKKAPPTPDNIREIKEIPHKSHSFSAHRRIEKRQ